MTTVGDGPTLSSPGEGRPTPVKTWDLFLSHASEDKATFVRPLADRLTNLGISVAYDEFTFRLGDSLVASIDRGIEQSGGGVIVLSEHFFIKPWPQHEKNGLLHRLVTSADGTFLLIPLWHGVTQAQVATFSRTLADRLAVDTTGLTIEQVALRIVERARPDIFRAIARRLAFEKSRVTGRSEYVPLDELKRGPIRHESLPIGFVNRARIVATVFQSVSRLSLPALLDSYQRDLYPDIELRVWEWMAACYMQACADLGQDDPRRQSIYAALLALSLSEEGGTKALDGLEAELRGRLIPSLLYKPPWEDSSSDQ